MTAQMLASPTMRHHQLVKLALYQELAALCPEELGVTSEIEVKLAPLRPRR